MLLLTGDVGTGKTTTTRALLGLLDRDVFTALVITPFVTADELLRVLLVDFGVVSDLRLMEGVSRQSLVDTLNRFLLSLSSVGASALAGEFDTRRPAEALAERLRRLGGEVSVDPVVGSTEHYLVWVGPYATPTDAQAMDADLKSSVGLGGTRIVPDEGPSTP
tara:strand:- start:691 stop:1179 length:489 start_codon:yes stop_codon:yes gene_type:complete